MLYHFIFCFVFYVIFVLNNKIFSLSVWNASLLLFLFDNIGWNRIFNLFTINKFNFIFIILIFRFSYCIFNKHISHHQKTIFGLTIFSRYRSHNFILFIKNIIIINIDTVILDWLSDYFNWIYGSLYIY